MLTIGVLTHGKYGRRLLDTLTAHTEFEVTSADTHPTLPDFIDEPARPSCSIPTASPSMVLNLVTIPIR